jgi:hypothetical protein
MALLTALCAAAIVAAWAIVLLLTPGRGILRVAIVGFAAMTSSPGWSLRPQVLTLALCAATLWILVRQRLVPLLPILVLVWANLHGAVALGGVLIAAAWCSALATGHPRLGRLTVVGALSLLATVATPLGITLWTEVPQSLARLHAYGVSEWKPLEFTSLAHAPVWIAAVVLLMLAILRRQRLRSFEALTMFTAAAAMFVLATRGERNIPPFLVCAAPAIGLLAVSGGERRESPSESPRRRFFHAAVIAASAIVAAVAVGLAWHRQPPRLRWKPLPDALIAAINACPGRLYTRYDEGGYLIWFVPDRKVFVDNRQDPFPTELVLEHIKAEQSGDYRALFDRYDISCSLNPPGSVLAGRLLEDGWREVGGTRQWKVYRKPAMTSSAALQ